jgi:hypothetical protein
VGIRRPAAVSDAWVGSLSRASRNRRKGKLWIAAVPFVLGPLLVLLNRLSDGSLLDAAAAS